MSKYNSIFPGSELYLGNKVYLQLNECYRGGVCFPANIFYCSEYVDNVPEENIFGQYNFLWLNVSV